MFEGREYIFKELKRESVPAFASKEWILERHCLCMLL